MEWDGQKEVFVFGDNTQLAGIVGIICMAILSMANGVLSVLTRMMQSIHVAVMMAYIAVISFLILLTGLLIEKAVVGGPLRVLNYSAEQYMFGFGCGLINILALLFKIIAY